MNATDRRQRQRLILWILLVSLGIVVLVEIFEALVIRRVV